MIEKLLLHDLAESDNSFIGSAHLLTTIGDNNLVIKQSSN